MKKMFCLLLASLFILASCTVVTPPNSSSEGPSNNVFSVGTLPEIGEFTGKKKVERFYDKPTYEFIPSSEYGEIIPFIGNYKMFEVSDTPDWEYEQGYAYYGFCTPDGKIVMDASSKTNYINYSETDDGFGYYTVSRDIEQKEDAPDEFYSNESWLIPKSGEWIVKLNPGSWVSAVSGGIITVCEYPMQEEIAKPKSVFYDYDGNELFTLENIDSVGLYSSGLMSITEWVGNEYTMSYINGKGERVLGPYRNCSNFNEKGFAYVTDLEGECYFINKNGVRMTTTPYESIFTEQSADGKTVVYQAKRKDNNKLRDIIGEYSNLIGTVRGTNYISFRFPDNGDIYYYYTEYDYTENNQPIYSTERMVWKRLSDGADFVCEENGLCPNEYGGNDNLYIYKDKTDGYVGDAIIVDSEGKTLANIEDFSSMYEISDEGRYVSYSTGDVKWTETEMPDGTYSTVKGEDTRKMHLYDLAEQKELLSLDGSGYIRFVGRDDRYALINVYGDDMGVLVSFENYVLYDTLQNKTVLSDCRYLDCTEIGGKYYFKAVTSNKCTLYDENLKPLLTAYYE